jgi:hypothetical protein
MRTFLCSLFALTVLGSAQAQTVATFESLTSKLDTAYINYAAPGTDVGFSDGLAYFPCVYDTSFGYSYWASGFAYSSMRDSVTSGFANQYAAKTASGFAGSHNYVVAYGAENTLRLTGIAAHKSVNGFYITNSTYAYNSMRDGDGFSRKFSAANKDWFRLDIFALRSDTLGKDSVSVYLADFRHTDTTFNFILRDWQWVDLMKLGKVDSLYFRLQSSDTGSFGMNTPAYFCMDNFITNESGMHLAENDMTFDIKVYPNPTTHNLCIQSSVATVQQVELLDMLGRSMAQYTMNQKNLVIDMDAFPAGTYLLRLQNGNLSATTRIVKQ